MTDSVPHAPGTPARFDLRVTAAVLLTLFLQFGALFAWGGQAAARIGTLETRMASLADSAERLARIEAEIALGRHQLERIEARLDGFELPVRNLSDLPADVPVKTGRGRGRGQ